MERKIARVFPRKTKATPDDPLAFFGEPPLLALPEIDEVHISVTFTYDRKKAEELAYQWEMVGVPVKVGGPAYGDSGGEFVTGMYLKKGYTITSRGCNNNCWFCMARQREGCLRELKIKDGWDLLDNNLLQCSESHIRAVFEMLKRQPHRFDRLWESNPKEWDFWMNHVCQDESGEWYGWGHVLDYIGVEWRDPWFLFGQLSFNFGQEKSHDE